MQFTNLSGGSEISNRVRVLTTMAVYIATDLNQGEELQMVKYILFCGKYQYPATVNLTIASHIPLEINTSHV